MKRVLKRLLAVSAVAAAMALPGVAGADPLPRDLTPVTSMGAPAHPPVEIVREGRARAVVYVADAKPSANLGRLVAELVEVVRLGSGATLEQVAQPPAAEQPALVIGDCEETRKAGIDAAKIPIEGFEVKTAANRVYLVGSTQALPPGSDRWAQWSNDGTAWAVADFLERFVGVRWYWPTIVGGRSVVPAKTLAVQPAFYSDQPVFRKREYSIQEYSKNRGEWRARWYEKNDPIPSERAIPAGVEVIDMIPLYADLRMGNSWPYQVKVHDPQQLWKNQAFIDAHKEMFSKKKNGERNFSMLCYSSQETFDFLMAGCEALWDKGTKTIADPKWNKEYASWVTATCVTVSPFDMPLDCACNKCQEVLKTPNGPSRLIALFVKKMAEELKRRWPDKKVMYLPYWNYARCPEDVEFPDNVEIQLCTTPLAKLRDDRSRMGVENNIRAWRKKSPDRLQTWEYSNDVSNYAFAPAQFPHVVKKYYTENRDLIVGSYLNGQLLNEWSKAAPTMYCWAKVLWNPDVDVDAVMDVMCERMFGKAAKTSRELLGIMCDRWENTNFSAFNNSDRYIPSGFRQTWPRQVVEKMAALWKQAREELKDDNLSLQRFDYFTWTFEDFLKEAKEQQEKAQDKGTTK
jgi:hypothetical protein